MDDNTSQHNKMLKATELATELNISRMTVSNLTKCGMPCVYFGTKTTGGRGSRPRYDLEEVKK